MVRQGTVRALAFAFTTTISLTVIFGGAAVADEPKYPNWKGQWITINPRLGGQVIKFDPTKPWGPAQQAPLTPEYQKVLEASMADQARGGIGNYPTARCLPGGMPRMMASPVQEYIVTPETTYVIAGTEMRRVFTDGREWPSDALPTFQGFSIGKWLDEDGDGIYDVLEVETRNFMGPRSFDNAGTPLHADNQTVIKERIYRDKQNPDLLHDEMTTIDNALTRPWTVLKTYRRTGNPHFVLNICTVGNNHVQIGSEAYFLSADGHLMPTKKNQAPPDLRYFQQN